MNIVDIPTAVLPSAFPLSEAHPPQPASYLVHDHFSSPYADSRQSSKENTTPPLPGKLDYQHHHIPVSPRVGRVALVHSGAAPLKESQSPQNALAGKKRSANGQVKEFQDDGLEKSGPATAGHSRNTSSVSNASNATVVELSQQLRTRLTYAMIKVQNGWQNRCLDEVESLASASPRSTTFTHYSETQQLLSPRAAISVQLSRQSIDRHAESTTSPPLQTCPTPLLMNPPASKKGLAPSATILVRPPQNRRRPSPNMRLDTAGPSDQQTSARPTVSQRTPSQNAVLEADAVETLLFMASPNHSGKHPSQFSPVTTASSVHNPTQTSPLRTTFSNPTSPKRVAFATSREYSPRYGRDKNTIIDSMLGKMDKEAGEDLEEALKLMDRYHATKVTA